MSLPTSRLRAIPTVSRTCSCWGRSCRLTLLALVLGERLMGIPGMILAPVVLNYIRLEAASIEVKRPLDPPIAPV